MTSEFQVAFAACCALHKANTVPEVEAIKRLLDPLIRARFEHIAERLLDELLTRLGRIPVTATAQMRAQILDALLTALLGDVEAVYALPFDRETRDAVREAVDALLAAGGRNSGAFDPTSPLLPVQAAAAERELVLLLQEAVVGRFGELRTLLGRFLTDEAVRAGQSILGVDSVLDQQAMRLLVPEQAVTLAVDAWAYGTFVTGGVVATDLRGVTGYRLYAQVDGRETAFCHWINGRIVPIERVRRQLKALQDAALSGNREAMIQARPFLSSAIAKRGNELQFERFFRRAGLPPYHFGCRTTAKPVRG